MKAAYEHLRLFALDLPETREEFPWGECAVKVRGKTFLFMSLDAQGLRPSVKLPVDTVATIQSAGLLGDKYLSLEPGNEDQLIQPGGTVQHTQSPMSLESLIGQYIFSQGGKKGGEDGKEQPPQQK